MEYQNHFPIIFLIAGKARSGKSTIAKYLKDILNNNGKKVIISPYTKYLKKYIEDITEQKITEENKPRELLQKLSSDLIKNKLGYHDVFIRRQIEDINIYSYFFDVIIIPDVRFKNEIEVIKEKFNNVISIGVIREHFKSDLTEEQKKDITEIDLDDYQNYDIKINNTPITDLKEETLKIIQKIDNITKEQGI